MTRTNEEILKDVCDNVDDTVFSVYDKGEYGLSPILSAMEISNRKYATGFFKWYGVKMAGFIEYIKDIRPIVTSNEIEEKIQEFEGKPIDELFNLYLEHLNKGE